MIIYKTTNLVNGKIYIGKDKHNNPKYLGSGIVLIQAIKKYGIENFVKEIIDSADTADELNEKEIYWIKEHQSFNRNIGYNIAVGGEGGDVFTYKTDEEKEVTRKNISDGLMGHVGVKHTDEFKQHMSEINTGKTLSEETKVKIGIASKQRFEGESGEAKRNAYSERMKNRTITEETKQKMAESKRGDNNPMKREENKQKLRGIKRSEESNEKNRQKHLGKKMSEEQKEKISQKMKEHYAKKRQTE